MIFNSEKYKQNQIDQMSKAKTNYSSSNKSMGLKKVGDLSAYFSPTHELPLDAHSVSSNNSAELSAPQAAALIHIELGDHLKTNKNYLDIKKQNKKRKRSYNEPGNGLIIKEIDQEGNNQLEIPVNNNVRVKSQPFKQPAHQQGIDSTVKKIEAQNLGVDESINKANYQVEYPSIEINQLERYAEYREKRHKEKNNRYIKSSKPTGNPNVVMLKVSASTEETRLQTSHYQLRKNQKDNIVSHDSSNLIFNPSDIPATARLSTLEERYTFIHTTVPPNSITQLNFIREDRCCYPFINPQYSLSLQTGDFLLNAKKQWGHINSHYIISATEAEYPEKGESFMGHLQGSFFGSQFSLYINSKENPQLVASIFYEPSISCCSSHYRKIQVYFKIPSLEQSPNRSKQSLKEQFNDSTNPDRRNIVRLITKQPKWNEKHGVYILSFKGKSKLGSIKNMVLIQENKGNDYIMMFCKTDNHKFLLQVSHPMTPFIAMGILLSSFDFKLCSQ